MEGPNWTLLSLHKNITINLDSAWLGLNHPGNGVVVAFCGVHFLELWPVGGFQGIIKLQHQKLTAR